MSEQWIDRGWLFAGAGATSTARPGLQLSHRGGIGMVKGQALIRQSIFLLLATRRGERVMRPDYGCNLDRLVFLANDVTTAGLAIHYTRKALERWEPRIEILRLDANPHPEAPFCLEISLDYRILADGSVESLRHRVDLSGESS